MSLSGGLFYGSDPLLGSFVFGNIPPLTGADFSGVITNVVQNPNDPGFPTGQPSSFQSGDFSFGGASFGFEFLTGPGGGGQAVHRSSCPRTDRRHPPPTGADLVPDPSFQHYQLLKVPATSGLLVVAVFPLTLVLSITAVPPISKSRPPPMPVPVDPPLPVLPTVTITPG